MSAIPPRRFFPACRSLSASSLLAAAAFTALGLAPAALGQTRAAAPEEKKAYIRIVAQELSLAWNGDQGDNGRGNGEVYMAGWFWWPTLTEKENPQKFVIGPLGGSSEFPSGKIVEDPKGSGKYKVESATVVIGETVYHNWANCPVPDYVEGEVRVWDEDSNKDIVEYTKIFADAAIEVGKAALGSGAGSLIPTDILSKAIVALVNLITADADDPIGNWNGKLTFPNPCLEAFGPIEKEVDLASQCAQLWKDCDAEGILPDGSTAEFDDYGISPPDPIGKVKFRISGGPMTTTCSQTTCGGSQTTEMGSIDLGQIDEATLSVSIKPGASIGYDFEGWYESPLDLDNDMSTGCTFDPYKGAEFVIQVHVKPGGAPERTLYRWNPGTSWFDDVPDGIEYLDLSDDRNLIVAAVDLGTLRNPVGPIAAWGVISDSTGAITDVAPSGEEAFPIIHVHREYTGYPSSVVASSPRSGAATVGRFEYPNITFAKAMEKSSTFLAVHCAEGDFLKEVEVHFTSNRTMEVRPLTPWRPQATYTLTIESSATDTVGAALDGDNDGESGGAYTMSFTVAPDQFTTTDASGKPRKQHDAEMLVYAAGSQFPPTSPVLLYMINHDGQALAHGVSLQDVSGDGPTIAQTDYYGNLQPTYIGVMPAEVEANLVADLDFDGVFNPEIDRIDSFGIGFYSAVLDCNHNGIQDKQDLAAGISKDCNGNLIPDECDIASGRSADINGNGIPDECDHLCFADFNGDGKLNVRDFIDFKAAWDRRDPRADWNKDGKWNIRDFINYQADFQAALHGGC